MKNRIELAKHFAALGFTKGVEVGVCDGRYSEILMQEIPGLTLYGVDPYMTYPEYTSYRSQDTLRKAYEGAKKRLAPYAYYEFVLALSVEAAKLVPFEALDFVFIDGNHDYEYVRADIAAWAPKVRRGGIVSGHDYYIFRSGNDGVVRAVDEYTKEYGYDLQTTGYDKDAHRDDRQPSWWFQK